MRPLEQSDSYRKKVKWWFPGAREVRIESECLTGTEFQLGKMKKS